MDKWTYFVKNAENIKFIPDNIEDEELRTAYTEAAKHNWSPAELKAYDGAGVRNADLIQEHILQKISVKQKEKKKVF